VVLTMEASPAFAKHALNAGALGYVLKEHADRDLIAAVRGAAHGESYITPEVAVGLDAMRIAAETDRLSSRESRSCASPRLGIPRMKSPKNYTSHAVQWKPTEPACTVSSDSTHEQRWSATR